jgi:hypothetical protein
MHREQTEHREHRAHPSMAWTTESATPLIRADTLLEPPARNTVCGRTRIWKGNFERASLITVHARTHGSSWLTLFPDPSPSQNKKKKTVSLVLSSICKNNLPFCCMLIHSLLCLLFPPFSSLFPFLFFFTYFVQRRRNWVIGCLDFFGLLLKLGYMNEGHDRTTKAWGKTLDCCVWRRQRVASVVAIVTAEY